MGILNEGVPTESGVIISTITILYLYSFPDFSAVETVSGKVQNKGTGNHTTTEVQTNEGNVE